ATPAVLAHDRIDANHIDPAADVVLARSVKSAIEADGAGAKITLGAYPRHTIAPRIQTLDLAGFTAEPIALITAHGLAALRLQPTVVGWLVESSHPITEAQVRAATRTAAATGLIVEAAERHQKSPLGRDASLAAIVLALGVLAMTVGLIRAESVNERRTLT